SHIVLLNCDVCSSFPLPDMLANMRRMNSFEALQSATKYDYAKFYTFNFSLHIKSDYLNMLTFVLSRALPVDYVRLDQDILSPLAGKKQLYTYETLDFWEQIKTPGISLKCSALYLAQYRYTSPHLLASGDGTKSATIMGDVFIHPSAKAHPTAKVVFSFCYNLTLFLQDPPPICYYLNFMMF
ncbi:hypothetical protein GW17_00059648, partial [Ensete ventricosum]